jgi:chromosome partitioning protein
VPVSTSTQLGWPEAVSPSATGLGWPPEAAPPDVSRETEPLADTTLDELVSTAAQVAASSLADRDAEPPISKSVEQRRGSSNGVGNRRRLPTPAHTRVLVVANQKGGVGKTTTAVNVAAALAQHGLRVLLVDLDPQGNASTALSVEHGEGSPGVYDVLIGGTPILDVVVESRDVAGLFVVPATIDVAGAEIELVSMVARETRLLKALTAHLQETGARAQPYHYVLIDCPPSLGLLTVNALSAADEVLVPIQCEYYAMEGLGQLMRTVEQIREHLNPRLHLGAIVLTMYDARTRLAAAVADEVRRHFGDQVLGTAVPRSVRISEAPSHGQTVLTYDTGSPGALAYLEVATELAHQVEEATR